MTGSCCGSDAQCACNALRGVLPGGLYRTVSDVFCVCVPNYLAVWGVA